MQFDGVHVSPDQNGILLKLTTTSQLLKAAILTSGEIIGLVVVLSGLTRGGGLTHRFGSIQS